MMMHGFTNFKFQSLFLSFKNPYRFTKVYFSVSKLVTTCELYFMYTVCTVCIAPVYDR